MSHEEKTHKELACVSIYIVAFNLTHVDYISPPKC